MNFVNLNSAKNSLWKSWSRRSLLLLTTAAIACGTVVAVRAQNPNALTVKSDVQEANTTTGVITAKGNVRISYPARNLQATAAQAQYYSKERQLVLSGNVYVLQDGNSIRAEQMTYSIDQGRFLAKPAQNRQVESTYIIPETSSDRAPVAPITLPGDRR